MRKALSMGILFFAAGILGSCGFFGSRNGDGQNEIQAVAELRGFTPNTILGTIHFRPEHLKGLRIEGEIQGLLPGHTYAIHVHENGDCSSPDAAGEHFDPGQSGQHGQPGQSPGNTHAGDLPNITANDDGVAKINFMSNSLGIGDSPFSIVGRGIVLHAQADDYMSQPSGNSGEPIACGVIVRAR